MLLKKWCQGRAEQSRNTLKLKGKAETSKTLSNYTCLRPSKILQLDKAVCQVMRVLTEEYSTLPMLLLRKTTSKSEFWHTTSESRNFKVL